ncbi:DUF421 domain-containing protein [Bacillus sp. EB01]|uniref:DUF421 domain-containing protein n=1 Tax=Bacillus sp. EB01 TaxID=1347086 RepID=UPI0005C4C41A|nr:YetF domain-containing protein [Bacillus sp. EB01]
MEATFSSILRTAVSFILLLVISYFFGRQINAHRNHFNMAMAITIGSLVANMGFNINLKFWPMVWSFVTTVLIYYAAANVSFRARILEKWLSGTPSILIENGQINSRNLAAAKYTEESLLQQLREKDIFSIKDVQTAILEPSGVLSVQKKEPPKEGNFVTQIPLSYLKGLIGPSELIIDGNIVTAETAPELYSWLDGYLYGLGYTKEDVAYAVLSSQGTLLGTVKKSISPSSAQGQ